MNYNSFFGFSESPFLDAPDLRFLFLGQQHETLLAALAAFVQGREGVALVTGEEGVGKTMLALALAQRLPPACHSLLLSRPSSEPLALSLLIGQALGLDLRERNMVNLSRLEETVRAAAARGEFFVIILDEAHLLTDQHLDEVYILSQIQDRNQQLMPIILLGRKGLRHKVAGTSQQRLLSLIHTNLELTALSFEETPRYIDHRLKQVGSSYQACFADGCGGQIFARTGGIPRRINQVCHQALIRAWQENRPRVTRDLLGGEEPAADFKPLVVPGRKGVGRILALFAAGALTVSLAGYVALRYYPGLTRPLTPAVTATSEREAAPTSQGPALQEPVRSSATVPLAQEKGPAGSGTVPDAPVSPPETTKPDAPPPSEPGGRTGEETPPGEAVIHRVTSADGGLLRIVAARYPKDRERGYDAVILANPQIVHEDMIYAGWTLVIPQVDKNSRLIFLPNKQYYALFRQFTAAPQVEKVVARLKELDLRFTVRETRLRGDYKIYRLYLGGYDSQEELKQALSLAEKN